jgi:hypothetical protein
MAGVFPVDNYIAFHSVGDYFYSRLFLIDICYERNSVITISAIFW